MVGVIVVFVAIIITSSFISSCHAQTNYYWNNIGWCNEYRKLGH